MNNYAGWETHEVMGELVGRDTVAVAEALHLSIEMIKKWKMPVTGSHSGARNDLDRLNIAMKTIKKIDTEKNKVANRHLAPIYFLCEEHGLRSPVEKAAVSSNETETDLVQAMLNWQGDIGETAVKLRDALKDGRVTAPELKGIQREFLEDCRKGEIIMAKLAAKMENDKGPE